MKHPLFLILLKSRQFEYRCCSLIAFADLKVPFGVGSLLVPLRQEQDTNDTLGYIIYSNFMKLLQASLLILFVKEDFFLRTIHPTGRFVVVFTQL